VLGAASAAHAGVPLPVVAETTGMPSLAAVVKRIAPSVVGIESRGRVAAEPDTKRRRARSAADRGSTSSTTAPGGEQCGKRRSRLGRFKMASIAEALLH
jgi:S1-C subfamily serine protease